MSRKQRAPRRDAGRARGAPIVDTVLARTLEELAAHGHEGLSVERIARSAQVNKTSVYRRWPTREALVAAALEGVLGSVSAQAPDTGSLRGDLIGLLTPVAALLEEPIGRAVLRAALAESTAGAAAAMAARALEAQTSAPVRALVARAKARGEWRAAVQGEQLMFLLVGALIHRALLEHEELSARWLTALVELVLQGVTPRAP